MTKTCDMAVIGAGPGGYVAALRAAQLRKKVILIEKEKVGGTCMNWGCIPTKFLLQQTKMLKDLKHNSNFSGSLDQISLDWSAVLSDKDMRVRKLVQGIEFLLEKNGVQLIRGDALLREDRKIEIQVGDVTEKISADNVILAMGSSPARLPFCSVDGQSVLNSRHALDLGAVPATLAVIGAGAIGLEMATIYARLGCDVTIIELLPQILPGADSSIAKRLERLIKKEGIKIFTRMQIERVEQIRGQSWIYGKNLKNSQEFELQAEKVLMAVGRRPNTQAISSFSMTMESGFVRTSPTLETDIPGIYAIGDLNGGKLLAHKASHEGLLAVENADGDSRVMNHKALPAAVFTDPEYAAVGLTEKEARDLYGDKIKVGLFPLQANGRALTLGEQDGCVKIIADEGEHVLGAHILAPHASELIGEVTLAIEKGLKLKDVAAAVHIHPTLSEAIMEASLKARGQAIHMLNL